MSRDLLALPPFDRLHDVMGLWLMETLAFAGLQSLARGTDWRAHMAAPAPRVLSTAETVPSRSGKSIATIRATGTLMKSQGSFGGTSTVQLRRDIRTAAADPNVSGILLAIDSPGGTAAGTMDLGNEVRAARRKKPVYAYVDDMTASAAYWMASQADMIFAGNPTAKVGSIGTVQAVYDMSAAAEKDGVKVHLFATGPLKGMGIPGTPFTEEHAANMQSLINETQSHFDAAVRGGRGMSAAQLAAVRSGGIFPATEAVGLKLIDGIKTFDQTLEALAAAR